MAGKSLILALARRSRSRLQRRPKKHTIKKRKSQKRKTVIRSQGDLRRRPELRALSLACAELAVAILAKQKNVENRTWALPETIQSADGSAWLALHVGGKTVSPSLRKHMLKAWDADKARKEHNTPWKKMDLEKRKTGAPLPQSAIVGLIHVRRSRKYRRGEQSENPWALGPFCWEIDRAIRLDPPIENVTGTLGAWSIHWKPSGLSSYARRRLYSVLRTAKQSKNLGRFLS